MTNAPITPPRRTLFVDAINGAIGLARRSGLSDAPVLERQALMASARAHTGLEDFGDTWFEEPLDRLLEAVREEANLNPGGQWAAQKQVEKCLHDRLWAQQWFAEHPEILSRPLRRPVIVVGPMRTGTTRIHRLLAADRRFSHLRSFETISPVPRPGYEPGGKDFRPILAKRIMRVARLANPRTLNIHPTGPYQPEEELGLLVNSFWGMKHEAQWWVPSYGRWCEKHDATGAYEQMARLLKLVGWSQQASSLRPWILKTPQHMMDLPLLLKIFPDARLIFTHRDPLSVVGSAASLAWNQTVIYSDSACPRRVGQEWLRKTRLQIERMRAARDAIPRHRRIDIHFEDMDRDWRGTMSKVYEFLELDIEPALRGMEDYQRRSTSLKLRPHRYSLQEFGLTSGEVLEQLGDYVDAYDITLDEGRALAG